MSKSLKRVLAALDAQGVVTEMREVGQARTAQDAADAVGCDLNQIVKSIIFAGLSSGQAVLFLTAGGNRVDDVKAAILAQEELGKADASLIRTQTGFAIGGVSPLGHLNPIRAWMDSKLMEFDEIWAAGGTPRHLFSIHPEKIKTITNAQVSDFT